MALTSRRDAEVFAQLLDGGSPASASAELEALADLARALPRPAVRPDPQFVARLRGELVSAAEQRAAALLPRQATVHRPRGETGRATPGPRTLHVRFPRRVVPALAATLVGLAVLVLGLSSRALPGDRLYDVKLEIGQAQVRLAGSDLARGQALLGQVDHRLDEVDALVGAGDPRAAQVDVALNQATSDLADAQRVLLASGDGPADPEALRSLADASVQAYGRLKALQPLLPTGSQPELHRLLDLLATGERMISLQVAACGAPCTALRSDLARLGLPDATALGAGASSAGADRPAGGAVAVPPAPVGVPTVAPTAGAPLPGPPAGSGASLPGASLPGASLPGVSASLPGAGVSVPGATLTTTAGSLPVVTLPPVEATVGSLTASVSVPAVGGATSSTSSTSSAPAAPAASPTTTCLFAVGGLCVG